MAPKNKGSFGRGFAGSVRQTMARLELPVILLFFFLFSTALCWRQLSNPREVSAPGADMAIHYPFKAYWIESLKQGDPALWNPFVALGIPFVAHPSVSAFSPFNLLHLSLPLPWAFKIETLLHFFLGAVGMYLLLRAWGCGRWAGLLGGLSFSFQAFGIVHHWAGQVSMGHAAAWMPWVVLALDKAVGTQQWRYLGAAGGFGALCMFEGYPQVAYYTLLLGGSFLLACAWRKLVSWSEAFLMGGGFLASFVLLAACLLFPASEFVANSNRAGWGYEAIMTDYEEPRKLLFLLRPFFLGTPVDNSYNDMGHWSYHETALYVGLLPTVLFLVGLLLRGKSMKLLLWLAATGSLAWVLAMGRSTPWSEALFKFFYEFVPGFGVHRSIARLTVVTGFCLAAGGALALQRLGEVLAQGLRGKGVGWGKALSFVLLPAVVIYTAVDLYRFGITFMGTRPNNYHNKNILFPDDFAQVVVNDKDTPRIQQESQINANILFRVGIMKGNDMTLSGEVLTYREACSESYHDNPLSDLVALKYMWCPKDISSGGRWRAFRKDHYINDKVLPRAFLVGSAKSVPRAAEAINLIRQGFADPAATLLLQSAVPAKGDEPGFLGAAPILSYRNNEVVMRCQAPRPCYLILTDTFFPGWKATVDGKRVPILRADGAFRAIRIESPGEHEVRMVYRPLWLYLGLALSLPAWVLLLVFWRRWEGLRFTGSRTLELLTVWTQAVLGLRTAASAPKGRKR